MIERFQGPAGEAELRMLLEQQVLLVGAWAAIDELIPHVSVSAMAFPPLKQIYAEGEPYKRTLYLLLDGKVDLSRNRSHVAPLGRGQFFGEFPLLDTTDRYNVTVEAAETAYVAPIEWTAFTLLADKFPRIWRNMANELAVRLRGSRTAANATKTSEEPKSVQEAVVRLAWRLPPKMKWAVGVLVAVCVATYFVWSSLPEVDRASLLGRQSAQTAPIGASASPK